MSFPGKTKLPVNYMLVEVRTFVDTHLTTHYANRDCQILVNGHFLADRWLSLERPCVLLVFPVILCLVLGHIW